MFSRDLFEWLLREEFVTLQQACTHDVHCSSAACVLAVNVVDLSGTPGKGESPPEKTYTDDALFASDRSKRRSRLRLVPARAVSSGLYS
jgi:hypothetical protein